VDLAITRPIRLALGGRSAGTGVCGAGSALAMLALFLFAAPALAELPCTPASPCEVEDGRYLASAPEDWDGVTPLPAVVFFHGWQSSAELVLGNRVLIDRLHDAGHLVILPDGRAKTWAHVGSPSQRRDEIPFIRAVVADAAARFPIDRGRLWVSGFSQGGSMAWDVACTLGSAFTAFAPVAGAFWEPLPDICPGGPVNLRHIHGTSDRVVPMAGRPIREIFRQGDVRAGMAVLRRTDRCPAAPSAVVEEDGLRCEVWGNCATGKELQLCLHADGHEMPDGWLDSTLAWLESLPAWGQETALPP